MPASITAYPPAFHLANAPVWWQVQSGILSNPPGQIVLTVTGTNVDGNTFRIRNTGVNVTFTAKTTPDATNPYEFPLFAAGVVAYADLLAEIFLSNEVISAYFTVARNSVGGENIVLTQRVVTPIAFFISSSLAGCTHVKTDVPSVWAQPNLSTVLQVWLEAGTEDTLLALFSASYRRSDRATDIDVSSAFSDLRPALPDPFSMLYAPPGASGFYAEAPESWMAYYVRYADKYGQPAVTRALQKSTVFYALRGSLAGDSLWQPNVPLRHAYRDRFFQPYRKPVVCDQPDWVYVWTGAIDPDTPFFLSALVTFDDNSTMEVAVTPPSVTTLQPNRLYWFVSGFMQLALDLVVIPVGATRVVAYNWRLYPPDISEVPLLGAEVLYRVEAQTDYNMHLLFDNGVGGCETVALRGKKTAKYTVKSEEIERPRTPAWSQQQGDFGVFDREGRKEWEANTGLYGRSDPYLEHLLQLPLAEAWLVDTNGIRFLPVRVEGREMAYHSDDDTVASLTFTIRALWRDENYNV